LRKFFSFCFGSFVAEAVVKLSYFCIVACKYSECITYLQTSSSVSAIAAQTPLRVTVQVLLLVICVCFVALVVAAAAAAAFEKL
jgi:hypothetical protein